MVGWHHYGCSSKVQPLLLTLDEGYLLTATPPDLERGVAPLGPPCTHAATSPWTWSCSLLEIIIKTTMKYHLTLVRMAIIKKSTTNKCWRGCGEKGMCLHCWWECKLIQPRWKMVWRFLKNLGIKPAYDPAIPLFGIYPEEMKIERDTCLPLFIAALLTIAGIPWWLRG